tara:strand:- start:2026 stop:2331 length:306 start_codon:yes stop_codon:yes gene_type:complete
MPTDNGKHKRTDFKCKFKEIKQTEVEKYQQKFSTTDLKALFEAARECAKKVIVGWSDVFDEEGNQVEYNQENLNEVLEIPGLAIAISTTYVNSLNEAKRKN